MRRSSLLELEESIAAPEPRRGRRKGARASAPEAERELALVRGPGRQGRRTPLGDLETEVCRREPHGPVRARVFDFGQPERGAADAEPAWAAGLADAAPYTIEAFEEPTPEPPRKPMEEEAESAADAEPEPRPEPTEPVEAETRPPATTPDAARSPDPSVSEPTPLTRAADLPDEVFARDLAEITEGRRVFTPGLGGAAADDEVETSGRSSHGHEVFDSLARNLAYATTFDVGDRALRQRFDTFDAVLASEQAARSGSTQPSPSNPAIPELKIPDLVEDFALLQKEMAKASGGDANPPPASTHDPPSEGEQAGGAKPAGETSDEPGGGSIAIRQAVPNIPAGDDLSPWSACAAMIHAWKRGAEPDRAEIVAGAEPWKDYAGVLRAAGRAALDGWKLESRVLDPPSIDALQALLQERGPLLVASSLEDAHPRLVTGLVGDGTGAGTQVHLTDPSPGGAAPGEDAGAGVQYSTDFDQFAAAYAGDDTNHGLLVAHA